MSSSAAATTATGATTAMRKAGTAMPTEIVKDSRETMIAFTTCFDAHERKNFEDFSQ
jgi:hypothetical protein